MKLVEGVYESLISTAIAEKLQRDFPESSFHVEKEAIDSAESHMMLAQYLAEIVSVVLKEYFRDKKEAVTISKQVDCINNVERWDRFLYRIRLWDKSCGRAERIQ